MPIRRPEPAGARLYRSLDWGDLAKIILLDTRYTGRDRQLSYRSPLSQQLSAGGAEAARAAAEFRRSALDDPTRAMLGAAQEGWLREAFAGSKQRGQRWQIVLQQLVMGDQLAAPGLTAFLPGDASAVSRRYYAAGEQLGALGLPWNLDSWGGYPAARARFLQSCAHDASNVVVLGGDSHNCWANNLPADSGGRLSALEFAGGSVTSPGFERPLSNAAPGAREMLIAPAIPTSPSAT